MLIVRLNLGICIRIWYMQHVDKKKMSNRIKCIQEAYYCNNGNSKAENLSCVPERV